ncbi:unnamed protein product [Nezara viridula]|uniref:Chitin-binding type-2 domain-containing protein n=1 Tax=Nezara viridula TaxID=85310 RepID=A0A9P0E8S4_NEZVI|nr:unnamed protein product [Nezara viridula]
MIRHLAIIVLFGACALAAVVQKRSPLPISVAVIGGPPPKKNEQDLSKIPGTPGVDYPLFRSVPPTSFSCAHVPFAPGMYANVETGCQAYHVCHDGREGEQGASFLCSNGTLFNQKEFACDWWYNVNCDEAPNYYELNLYAEKNPYYPKKKPEEAPQHGAYPEYEAAY